MDALRPLVVLVIVGIALVIMLRPVLNIFRSRRDGTDFLGALREQRQAETGTAILETAAYVSLVAGLLSLSAWKPSGMLVMIGIGLYLGLLVLPGFTRPLLGFATAVIALLRLEASVMIVVAIAGVAFFVARSVTRGLFRG